MHVTLKLLIFVNLIYVSFIIDIMNKRGIIKIIIVLIILVVLFMWACFYFINRQKQEVIGEQPIPEPSAAQESQAAEEHEPPVIQGEAVSEAGAAESEGDSAGGGSGGGAGDSGEETDEEFTECEYIKNSKSPECYPD